MAIPLPCPGDSQSEETADFDRLESLFAEIVPLDDSGRQQAIEATLSDRPDLQVEIAALLAAHDHLARADGSANETDAAGTSIGSIVGVYRLTAKIGEGGMGEVFRAERADGLFTQQVAVKLTRSTISHSESRRRFNQERQILASLRHEHIVRLLDGGTTATGQAFLIMEHVEGKPLTTFCRERAQSLERRLALFGRVCGAVQFAHQHGVVHRDLKPANVLVDGDGVPKVVDFGVAKLLEAETASGFTSTGMPGPMTPNYASPEQLRGLPVTSASDVYSLGVILYEMLAGVRPYETQGQTLERVLEMVAHRQPRRPSAAASDANPALPYPRARLRGDVDAIVLKAMSKEPGDRYASASELASDLTRYLQGDPVLARTPTTGYVLRRLARRHSRLVGVAAVALLAVLMTSAVAVWQWRMARRAQTRAEQRFNDVRQLANALIFKVHDAVAPLAGSTPVRRTIVNEAIGYLERLEAESADDPPLRLELSAAYRQLGSILGNAAEPNLGDREGARAQYERARELLLPIRADAQYDVISALVDVNLLLGPVYSQTNDRQTGRARIQEAVEHSTRYVLRHPDDLRGLKTAARAGFYYALTLPPDEAIPVWERTLASYERLLKAEPDDPNNQRNVALVGKYLGGIFEVQNRPRDARPLYERSLALDQARLEAAPSDQRVQFDAAISYSNVASVAETLGDVDEAARFYDRSLVIRRQLADADPSNMQVLGRLGFLLARIAQFQRERHVTDARAMAREAVQVSQRVADTSKDHTSRLELAYAWTELGLVEKTAAASDAACRAFRSARQVYSTAGDSIGGRHIKQAENAAREAASCDR